VQGCRLVNSAILRVSGGFGERAAGRRDPDGVTAGVQRVAVVVGTDQNDRQALSVGPAGVDPATTCCERVSGPISGLGVRPAVVLGPPFQTWGRMCAMVSAPLLCVELGEPLRSSEHLEIRFVVGYLVG